MAKALESQSSEARKRKRAPKNTKAFNDLWINRLTPPKKGQELYWDMAQKGLALLVGPRTKTFRSTFKLNGEWVTRTLGRFGEVVDDDKGEENANVTWARKQTQQDRALAKQGTDPRVFEQKGKPDKNTFEFVADQFITHYAKPRQRTWDQTERILKNNCKKWLKRPIAEITKQDVRQLLRSFIEEGHPYKAAVTRAWLKKLWRWAYEEDYVSTPIMEAVSIEYEKRERDRVFTDEEIRGTWNAADKIGATEGAYVKLLILLAPRKTALASLQRSDLDHPDTPTLWTTPFDLTKSRRSSKKKRVYLTPLPSLAQRIIKGMTRGDAPPDDRLFPDLPVHETAAGRPTFYGVHLKGTLVEHGAPKDFEYHAWRHTLATWLQNAGHSEWEIGLVLNHSASGVTAGYSHGYPLELKRKLLCKWADHVASIVQPEGVAVLR